MLKPQKLKILIINDDISYTNQLQAELPNNYKVSTAQTSEIALDNLTKKSYDLVITDPVLSQKNAFAVIELLNKRKPRVPVIVVTGNANKDMVIQSLHLGVRKFLEKPMVPGVLASAITECFHGQTCEVYEEQAEIAPGVFLNFQLQTVQQGDKEVTLTGIEFEILKTLWSRRNQKVLRREIIEKIWAHKKISDNNFDTQFSNLKKKVPAIKAKLFVIRGQGYIYRDNNEAPQ